MTTLNTLRKRMLMPVLLVSLFPVTNCCQQSVSNQTDGSGGDAGDERVDEVYITTAESKQHELAAYECDPNVSDCDSETQVLYESISVLDECLVKPRQYCFQAIVIRPAPPDPCPSGHCDPFIRVPRVSFYSEPDKRPVRVFANGKLLGQAKDVSYNAKRKLRTVSFNDRKAFTDTKGRGQNVMRAEIPVTYPVAGNMEQRMLVIESKY